VRAVRTSEVDIRHDLFSLTFSCVLRNRSDLFALENAYRVFFSISTTTCANLRVANRHILITTRIKIERTIPNRAYKNLVCAAIWCALNSGNDLKTEFGSHSLCMMLKNVSSKYQYIILTYCLFLYSSICPAIRQKICLFPSLYFLP
jgi:hypothetical protein